MTYIAEFDNDNSYIHNIRQINNTMIEIDSCEYWSATIYNHRTQAKINTVPKQLLPQTITVEKLNLDWFVTNIEFYDTMVFCR